MFTYECLLAELKTLKPGQLRQNVMIGFDGGFMRAQRLVTITGEDAIDLNGSPLVIDSAADSN